MTTSVDKQFTNLPTRSTLHLARKVWHICSGLFGLLIVEVFSLSQNQAAIVLLAVAAISLLTDLLRMRYPRMNTIVLKTLGPFMRQSEVHSLSGIPFFAFGTSMTLFFFHKDVAIMSVLFLIFADPIASLVGILYGKDEFLPNKSLQGSAAGFLTCLVIALSYCLYYHVLSPELFLFAIAAGVIGSVSEMASVIVDDNLTIPLISGAGLTVINYFIPLF